MKASYLPSNILNQFPRVALSPRRRFGADVYQIPRIVVAVAEDVVLGAVQQGQEFLKEALLGFGRELVFQAPEAAAQDGAPVVHGFAGGHPKSRPQHGKKGWTSRGDGDMELTREQRSRSSVPRS